MKIFKFLVITLTISAFLAAGCGRGPYEYPTLDTDRDGIPDDYEIIGNEKSCTLKCPLNDGSGSYVCKNCLTESDCNCNNIPDPEEPGTNNGKSGWEKAVDTSVKIAVNYALPLLGAFMAGRIIWNSRIFLETPHVTVQSIDYTNSKLTFNKGENEKPGTWKLHIIGKCLPEGETESKPCEMEVVATLNGEPEWSPRPEGGKVSEAKLQYYYDLKNSTVYGKSDNYLTVKGFDPTTGKDFIYELKHPGWLGFKTEVETINETDIFLRPTDGIVQHKLQFNENEPDTEYDERACFISTSDLKGTNAYILDTVWTRVVNTNCTGMTP